MLQITVILQLQENVDKLCERKFGDQVFKNIFDRKSFFQECDY